MSRRRAVPHTPEDQAIWAHLRARWPAGHSAYAEFLFADRRDALLLWSAQDARYRTFPVDMPPLELIGPAGVLVCGGALFLPANPYPAAL